MKLLSAWRVAVVVPEEHAAALLAGVRASALPGIGDYADWAWLSAPGEERFRPLAGAQPVRGTIGELERVPSRRVEWCIPRDAALLERLLAAIRAHHPWQVPAIFVDETLLPQD